MARRKHGTPFDTLWQAVRDGTAADVAAVIQAAGGIPEEREEEGDPTALMYAAALGRLDVVQTLVRAGGDANEIASHELSPDLPELPFLEPLLESGAIRFGGLSALGYAAAYGREAVVAFLLPHTSAALRQEAEVIARGRTDYLAALDGKTLAAFLKKHDRTVSGAGAARRALLAEHPKLSRWIVRCALCGREGYKPTLPAEVDRQGTAARVRRLFRPLALTDHLCERCREKAERGLRQAEALVRERQARLPPHVQTEVIQPKPKKKRPGADA